MSIILSEQLLFKHVSWLCTLLNPPPSSPGDPCPLKQSVSLPSLPTLPLPHRRHQGAAEKTKPPACSQLLCLPETTW